jgi:hypothetical protein
VSPTIGTGTATAASAKDVVPIIIIIRVTVIVTVRLVIRRQSTNEPRCPTQDDTSSHHGEPPGTPWMDHNRPHDGTEDDDRGHEGKGGPKRRGT